MNDAVRDLPDLASSRFGGRIIACSDEFFAPASRMLEPRPPVSRKGEFDEHGQWMDGWESRRRRGERRHEGAFDWAIVRLGAPGVIEGVGVDTTFFSGNQMESAALDGAYLPGNPAPDEVLRAQWMELLPASPLGPDGSHLFTPALAATVTHVRLRAAPDGGIARLRLYGTVLRDPREADGLTTDVAAATYGGVVTACSDMHFGKRSQLVAPGEARTMGEGWETRRRRGPGEDWAVVRLAGESVVHRIVVDTRHFLGNAPESCDVEGSTDGEQWTPLLVGVRLQPDQEHLLRVPGETPASWLRLVVHPDGGVARLRALGRFTERGRVDVALRWLSALPFPARRDVLLTLCGSGRWVREIEKSTPWPDRTAFDGAATRAWELLGPEDWREALAAHPRIGERPRADSQESREQSAAMSAEQGVLAAIAAGNAAYEQRFGFTYVVRASGRSAEEMLAMLTTRLGNEPDVELRTAAAQQWEITQLRITRLIEGDPA